MVYNKSQHGPVCPLKTQDLACILVLPKAATRASPDKGWEFLDPLPHLGTITLTTVGFSGP